MKQFNKIVLCAIILFLGEQALCAGVSKIIEMLVQRNANNYLARSRPDNYFGGVDLSGADLSGLDLYKIDLTKADLSGANLSGSNLYGTNFKGANLTGANLSSAILERTNFQDADLTGADFDDIYIKCQDQTTDGLAYAETLEGFLSLAASIPFIKIESLNFWLHSRGYFENVQCPDLKDLRDRKEAEEIGYFAPIIESLHEHRPLSGDICSVICKYLEP